MYKENINFGVEGDQATYFGHSDSNWNTEYITGLESYASPGSVDFRWKPFSAQIEKSFKSNTNLSITYFGDLRIYENNKLIFNDFSYKEIKQLDIEVSEGIVYFEYQYSPDDLDRYKLTTTSGFNMIEKQHFATLRITEEGKKNVLTYFYIFIISIQFFIQKNIRQYFNNLILNKQKLYSIFFLIITNLLIYFYLNTQFLIGIFMSLLLVSLFFNKNKETIKFQILLAPIQILKVFDLQIYSLPRMPGTVPYHHQVMALAMNSPVSILNFLRGGDNLFTNHHYLDTCFIF